MSGSTPPDEFADVNEAVSDEWVSETTPYERVREVISRSYTPVSAPTVAEAAHTAPKTARKHLNTLVEDGYVSAELGENGGRTYRRSSESLVVEQAADLLEHVSMEELRGRISEMRTRVRDFQEEFGVESPEELVVERTNQTLTDAATTEEGFDPETVRTWQTTRRNLAFANAALSIAAAERFVGDESGTSTDGAVLR